MKAYSILLITTIFCVFIACKKTKKDDPSKTDFDRKGMLTNIGNNIIIPSYQALQSKEHTFDSLITVFNAAPAGDKLLQLQNAFKDVYKAWQSCSPFELGTADNIYLNLSVNTFPTSTTKINNNISSGVYDLNIADNADAKGLPAIDYLLFGSNNTTLLSLFTTDGKATNRRQYLATLSAQIKTNVDNVTVSWLSAGGNYISTFINADGTDVGSSVGLLINKLDYDYEILKNDKLGIPLGKQTMGVLHPEGTEAYYSGISAQLALLQLQAMQSIYLGSSAQGGDGKGFDDYLIQINAQYNGGSLNDTIKHQFAAAITALQAVGDPLSATIQNNIAPANAAYLEVQKLLVLLKTDMPSAMGVLITYADNDGD